MLLQNIKVHTFNKSTSLLYLMTS
uniref:Uncharacterized protein n=1 Tax=Lepeophtheirus salmonis TaxID=72036 RepID=A0A0K2TUZ0_LEPSM